MTQPEYEQKKRECWRIYAGAFDIKDEIPNEAFKWVFDRAYALGKEKEAISQEEIENEAVDYAFGENKKRPDARPDTAPEYACEDLIDAFIAGANFALGKQEKDAERSKEKLMCLRDRTKVCNRCHACDIDTDAWHSMYSR